MGRMIVPIEVSELSRLYRMQGRVEAVQIYVDQCTYPDSKLIIKILGIDTSRMEEKQKAWQDHDVLPEKEADGDTETEIAAGSGRLRNLYKRQAMNLEEAEREGTEDEGTDH